MPGLALPGAEEQNAPTGVAPYAESVRTLPSGRPDGSAPLEARKRWLKRHHSSGVDWATLLAAVLLLWGVVVLVGALR